HRDRLAGDRVVDRFRTGARRREQEEHEPHLGLNRSLSSAPVIRCSKPEKSPDSAIRLAAWAKPVHAERASAPPVEMRRTPSAATSATRSPLLKTSMLNGFGATAATSALMFSGSCGPGA